LGEKLGKDPFVRAATNIGVVGLIVQMIGLLRWTFVVPVLANEFVNNQDASMRAAAVIAFKTVHQFGGVLLGEHLGQLFTIIWTVMITRSFQYFGIVPKWINWLGYSASIIYFLSQAELLATVIPGFPMWSMAGFIGSTLWLIWLAVIGVIFIKTQTNVSTEFQLPKVQDKNADALLP
jgi:hypothetical protein